MPSPYYYHPQQGECLPPWPQPYFSRLLINPCERHPLGEDHHRRAGAQRGPCRCWRLSPFLEAGDGRLPPQFARHGPLLALPEAVQLTGLGGYCGNWWRHSSLAASVPDAVRHFSGTVNTRLITTHNTTTSASTSNSWRKTPFGIGQLPQQVDRCAGPEVHCCRAFDNNAPNRNSHILIRRSGALSLRSPSSGPMAQVYRTFVRNECWRPRPEPAGIDPILFSALRRSTFRPRFPRHTHSRRNRGRTNGAVMLDEAGIFNARPFGLL